MSSMAKKAATAKTSTINRAATSSPPDLAIYIRDLDEWPRSWMGLDKDLPPGEKLVACFRPFLEHLASTSLSRKTIRKHVDNLWVLGGEIIRDLPEDPSLRRKDVAKILHDVIDDEGGPLIHGGTSEPQQNSFDSTCRKLRRFLSQTPR
jgi:hypothetical protein